MVSAQSSTRASLRHTCVDKLYAFIVLTVILISVDYSYGGKSDNMCTRIKAKPLIDKIEIPCIEAYKSSCGWFSLTYCTFYRKVYCEKTKNSTGKMYYKVNECCEGFIQAPNGTCLNMTLMDEVSIERIQNNTVPDQGVYVNVEDIPTEPPVKVGKPDSIRPPDRVSTKADGITLSHGAYAGIACAALLLVIITAFVIIAVRKKHKKSPRRKKRQNVEAGVQCVPLQTSFPIVKTKKATKEASSEERQSLNASEA